MRPLGISCYEDKLVENAIAQILEQIYEPKFYNESFCSPKQELPSGSKGNHRDGTAFGRQIMWWKQISEDSLIM